MVSARKCCSSSSTSFPVCVCVCPTSDLFVSVPLTASDIIISLHNPAGVSPTIAASGVEVRKGDYADPDSLCAAFAGTDKLLLVGSASP